MKQVRKMSNLVAEELQSVLDSQGVEVQESVFEERVSNIMEMLDAALNEGCKKKAQEGCSKKEGCPSEEEDDIIEEVDVSDIYMATDDTTIGSVSVAAGEYVEIDEIDFDNDTVTITVYDADGEVKADGVDVPLGDINTFEEYAEEVEIDEEAEVIEAVHIKGGKKVKVSAAVEKLRAKLKAKKGNGVNKFTIKNGKIVKKSADQLAADKKKSKVFAKQMKKFAKKRSKSLKKAAKLNAGKCSGSKKVCEGFDITSGNMTFAVEAGDVISYENGAISVVREGNTIVSGLEVSEGFIEKCVSEGVLEADQVSESDPVSESASLLTYKSDKGYILVKEGSEVPLGNRIRARGHLMNEGYTVTSEMLDKAADGEVVTL